MKILTLAALEEEIRGLIKNVTYTGVGKVNAAYVATKAICLNRPDVIINIGTAGSKKFNYGSVVRCNKFIQRDMDATVFGYNKYETPAEETPHMLEYLSNFSTEELKHCSSGLGICGTGDNFKTNITGEEKYNVVDMEAYAIAKVAMKENIPFICIKFISDGADGNAPKKWEDSLKIGAKKMQETHKAVQECLKKYFV